MTKYQIWIGIGLTWVLIYLGVAIFGWWLRGVLGFILACGAPFMAVLSAQQLVRVSWLRARGKRLARAAPNDYSHAVALYETATGLLWEDPGKIFLFWKEFNQYLRADFSTEDAIVRATRIVDGGYPRYSINDHDMGR